MTEQKKPYVVIEKYEGGEIPDARYIIVMNMPVSAPHFIDYLKSQGLREKEGERWLGLKKDEYFKFEDANTGAVYKIITCTYKIYDASRLQLLYRAVKTAHELEILLDIANAHGVSFYKGVGTGSIDALKDWNFSDDSCKKNIITGMPMYVHAKQATMHGIHAVAADAVYAASANSIDRTAAYMYELTELLPTGKMRVIRQMDEIDRVTKTNEEFALCWVRVCIISPLVLDVYDIERKGIPLGEPTDTILTNIDIDLIKRYYNVKDITLYYAYSWRLVESPLLQKRREWAKMRASESAFERIVGKAIPNTIVGSMQITRDVTSWGKKRYPWQSDPIGTLSACYVVAKCRQRVLLPFCDRQNDIIRINTDSVQYTGECPVKISDDIGGWHKEFENAEELTIGKHTYIAKDRSGNVTIKSTVVTSEIKEKLLEKVSNGEVSLSELFEKLNYEEKNESILKGINNN